MAEIPKRAVQFRLEVGADSRRALADVLFNLAIQIDHEGLSSHSVSGGYDSGYEQWLTMSDGPTHDEYVAQLNAWLEQNKTA
ncbi:hypothetical protein SAMN05443245_3387 [Paraburkholderia fungorum]|uniref:Uncharacterized protein n=1 Tax=Paraburkholderia fungorum TaxID=134537 RepID=A0A1H1GYX6_9BURK|nr:hypothetical protein [Paraburkholderia fungorum]SDR18339.1 hypothetical protein SAMN05443245_3387 [Paraburkholderia fungorum]